MDVISLLSSFVSQNCFMTAIQIIIGILLGFAIKRSAKYVLAAGLILFLISFVGIWSLPSAISLELRSILGDMAGKGLEAIILVLPYVLGVAVGLIVGIIVS